MQAMMYGLGVLAFSFLFGQFLGETLGAWLGVEANIGGVGFAMLLLIFSRYYLEKNAKTNNNFSSGIEFWNQLYVPVVIAMSASQNVRLAVSSGFLAILAGLLPTVFAFVGLPFLLKAFKAKP
ncbi:MAG: malonate transporter subunit MadL [Saprospiraceae bacterium]|jgi:malonate transporter MadL subunit